MPELQHPDRCGGVVREHPIGLLTELRFRVTVNTDNRLMSGTSMTREMFGIVEPFDYTLADQRWC